MARTDLHFDLVTHNFPPSSLEPLPGEVKRKKKLKLSAQHRRDRRALFEKNERTFNWFAGILVAYGLADWLLIPEPYKLSEPQRWPALVSIFVCGTILIFIGSQVWDERVGWKKWTFWGALLGTLLLVLAMTHWLQPIRPGGVVLVLLCSALMFLWLFGTFRRIDRSQLEQDRLSAANCSVAPEPEVESHRDRR